MNPTISEFLIKVTAVGSALGFMASIIAAIAIMLFFRKYSNEFNSINRFSRVILSVIIVLSVIITVTLFGSIIGAAIGFIIQK